MRFFSKLAVLAAAAAALVQANTITFVNQDAKTRVLIFTPNAGAQEIPSVTIKGLDTIVVDFPQAWVGNFYSVCDGKAKVPGMLGEVAFQGWNGITYFDVSAIVNANDHDGVKQMFPKSEMKASSKTKMSGCVVFPCNTAYYVWDDVQTVTTTETDLVCTLGNGVETKRSEDSSLVARNFVLGSL